MPGNSGSRACDSQASTSRLSLRLTCRLAQGRAPASSARRAAAPAAARGSAAGSSRKQRLCSRRARHGLSSSQGLTDLSAAESWCAAAGTVAAAKRRLVAGSLCHCRAPWARAGAGLGSARCWGKRHAVAARRAEGSARVCEAPLLSEVHNGMSVRGWSGSDWRHNHRGQLLGARRAVLPPPRQRGPRWHTFRRLPHVHLRG